MNGRFETTLEEDIATLERDAEEPVIGSAVFKNNIMYRMTEKKAYHFYSEMARYMVWSLEQKTVE